MSTTLTAGSTPAPSTIRKPRKKPLRFASVLFTMHTTGETVVRIEDRGPRVSLFTCYYVRILPSDWGFATSWEKWQVDGGDGTVYQTNTGGNDGPACCDCKGFEKHGHCRHCEASQALLAAGKLADRNP